MSRALPSSLLLLSRAFTVTQPGVVPMPRKDEHLDKLRETLSSLPDEVIEDVGLEVCADGYAAPAATWPIVHPLHSVLSVVCQHTSNDVS